MAAVLLLTKDTDYRDLVTAYYDKNDFNLIWTDRIDEAKEIVGKQKIDLAICDQQFGSISIVQLAEMIHSVNMSVIMVSLGDCFGDMNLTNFFDANIKEFVCKKADLNLTKQRLVYLLNNKGLTAYKSKHGSLISQVESIEINTEQSTIYHHSKAVHVTQLEYNLLILFLENKHQLLRREEILEKIWNETEESSLRKVDSFVKKLRQKMDLKAIESVRGLGYKWVE